MSERRTEKRANSSDRRDIRRPPLWFNFLLLFIAITASFFVRQQRQRIDADFTRVFNKSSAGPSELNQITAELAEMDLAKGALEKELESRLAYIGSLKALDFYLSIDTAKKTLTLKSGNEIVRVANVQIGAPVAVKGLNALKGAFAVAGKTFSPPAIKNGSGKYVIFLPNDRVIYSSPSHDGPSKDPKPGSFMVSGADLQAIWDQITPETRVYVF
ncbi:MAG: hypothetical protein AAB215_00265 [Planctomycetota bacterium]